MLKKKLLSVGLALSLMVSVFVSPASAQDNQPASRGEVANMVLQAADDYTPGLVRSDIIKGYGDGDTQDDKSITRAESFVMISRAFGTLPAPKGNDERLAVKDITFTDIPSWAETEVNNLIQAGVLVGDGVSSLASDEPVTAKHVSTIVNRIWALLGTNKKDDFYENINKEYLNNSVLPTAELSFGRFDSIQNSLNDQLNSIIQELLAKENKAGTPEQKIADFYRAAADMDSRNAQGTEPIKKYIDAINNATSLKDLLALDNTFYEDTGSHLFVDLAMGVNLKDSTKYDMFFAAFTPSLSKDAYGQENSSRYRQYMSDLLQYTGETPEQAQQDAELFFNFEKSLSEHMLERQDYNNVDKIYNPYSIEDLQTLIPAIDVKSLISSSGYQLPEYVIIQDVGLVEHLASYLTEENLPTLKASLKISVVKNFGGALDQEFLDISNQFQNDYYGTSGAKSTDELAALSTQNTLSDYLNQMYAERYFTEEAKKDVENMVKEFISIYEKRIDRLDWMSDATKEKAKKKLETMDIKIGYPDKTDSTLDQVEIKTFQNGGSYIGNLLMLSLLSRKENIALQGQPVDNSDWMMTAYTVNAYYNASANEIVFPAGILQAPFYDVNASREENLGGIGVVIAHEITHAFDNNGSKFDENGNATDWWTEEDYQKFSQLCEKVVSYYDGYEVAPGVIINGTQTLGENIADLGGIACALEAMQSMENPDYDKFFTNLAYTWAITYTRPGLEMLNQLDVHSANKARVNRMISAMDQFYDTYQISEGDGMFVAPEDRIRIW